METKAKLLEGYKTFRADHFNKFKEEYHRLAEMGQEPTTLVISCSDSRVNPTTILNSDPGEIFVVRNVGNIVPPYEDDQAYHGISSALEYGVMVLGIRTIIILGHANCGAVKAAIDTENDPNKLPTHFVQKWVGVAHNAMKHPMCCCDSINSGNRDQKDIEQASIMNSIANLSTYTFLKEKIEKGDIKVHGWYFDIDSGDLSGFDQEKGCFEPL